MKRKFFLHRQNAPMEADHVVYRVWIGESVREQRILTQLMSWAFSSGATLMSWSEDIDYYLTIESERVFPGRGLLDFGFIQADISAKEALNLAESGNWDLYESKLSQPKTFFYSVVAADPRRLDPAKGEIKPFLVLAEKSKYLSQSPQRQRPVIRFA